MQPVHADGGLLGLNLPSPGDLAGGGLLGGGGGLLQRLRGGGGGASNCPNSSGGSCHSDECLGLHRTIDSTAPTQQIVQQAPPAREEANHGVVMAMCLGGAVLVGAVIFGVREKQFLT